MYYNKTPKPYPNFSSSYRRGFSVQGGRWDPFVLFVFILHVLSF